jgi:DNA (cytosine-5)-methyltransferase 1
MLTLGSLFSGIGGLDLGLERAGMRVIWQSEIDPYACKVLNKHWPNVPNLGNIKEIDFGTVERPDVICGGYPCQPFSLAGQRGGASDPRHLWPECLRALRVLRPRYAVLENVRGHLSLGFSQVLGDLAAIGFNAEWQVIPAASVGAPHRRDRLFIVAYPNGERLQGARPELKTTRIAGGGKKVGGVLADPNRKGLERSVRLEKSRKECFGFDTPSQESRQSEWWQSEPNVGRVANGIPSRVDRLKGLGNAVVPQVAELIGRMIVEDAKC